MPPCAVSDDADSLTRTAPPLSLTRNPSTPSQTTHPPRYDIARARGQFDRFTIKQPDPSLLRDLKHGWMLPALLMLDECLWQRWSYWADLYCATQLPEQPIPAVELLGFPHAQTRKMLEKSLDCIPQHGSWQTWGGWQYVDYFLDWLLFGFGHKGQSEPPTEPPGCSGASNRLFQVFCLDAMLLWPHDYFGGLLADSAYGKRQGFYPTPHHICEFMTQMLCDETRDMRAETVCDPCVGTGRMLLHASNHSLRLYGCDIDLTLCKATLVNGYLWVPWLVRPIPWLDPQLAALEQMPQGHRDGGNQVVTDQVAQELSDCMAAAAPPHAQEYLRDSEHDPAQQVTVAPLLKRRKKLIADPTQGTLF